MTSDEAMYAVEHPKLYSTKQLATHAKDVAVNAGKAGLRQAKSAASLTAVVSGVENFEQYNSGEISGKEAIEDVAKDTAVAGGIGFATGFADRYIPDAAITMGVVSYDDVKDFAEGDISGKELAYNLGENAVRTVGAEVGMAVGGVDGAIAGTALAAEAYETSVEFVSDHIDEVAEVGSEVIGSVVETTSEIADTAKDVAADVKDAAAETLDGAKEKAADFKNSAADVFDGFRDKVGNVVNK